MKILVTGGAGYIGSFMAHSLAQAGHQVLIVDNLKTGHRKALAGFALIKLDLVSQKRVLVGLLKKERPEVVMHFAGLIQMGESVKKPEIYFKNNVVGSLNLFEAMGEAGIEEIIFSSSAGVYGQPERLPIFEEDRKEPTNPYGETKLFIEKMLSSFNRSNGLRSVSIRYFNAAGGSLDGTLGEDHPAESHLIPLAIKAALKKKTFTIFGGDYPTPDGTCLRDYIHVLDLVEAHRLALPKLKKARQLLFYNAGVGRGYSNRQVVETVKKISGVDFPVEIGPRRAGDAAALYASAAKIKKELGWKPRFSSLDTIISSAWQWHRRYPNGFASLS